MKNEKKSMRAAAAEVMGVSVWVSEAHSAT